MRGSDVQASLHYLARMMGAGEDPRFIARRLIILASEDIGLADPTALTTAVAAAEAVAMIGMPEGRLTLAHATIALALAPKSNAVTTAIGAASADVAAGRVGLVPPHLRDAHYAGAKTYGHGQGYRYAHDEPHGIAAQQYLPDELVGAAYYVPTDHGNEAAVAARLARIEERLGRPPATGRPGLAREAASRGRSGRVRGRCGRRRARPSGGPRRRPRRRAGRPRRAPAASRRASRPRRPRGRRRWGRWCWSRARPASRSSIDARSRAARSSWSSGTRPR